jgi:hypothetical protein
VGAADAKLDMGKVCQPVTNGHSSLEVRFTLTNGSRSEVRLLGIHPRLTSAGLVHSGTTVRIGSCSDVDSAPPGRTHGQPLAADEGVVVSFTFVLPPECPEPLAIQAVARTRIADVAGSGHRAVYTLYPDLGSIAFDTC